MREHRYMIRLRWPGRIIHDAPEPIRERYQRSYDSWYSADASADVIAQWARLPRSRFIVQPISASPLADPCPLHPHHDAMHGCDR